MKAVRELAAISRAALDRPLSHDLELHLMGPRDSGVVPGHFDWGSSGRGSGGPAWLASPGTLWLQLAIAKPIVDETRIVNRYVRPLLSALTKLGPPARYFGRDSVHIESRPTAGVAFGQSRGRAFFEALIGCESPYANDARILSAPVERVHEVVRDAYVKLGAVLVDDLPGAEERESIAWLATKPCAIGEIKAGYDASKNLRLGGDFMASHESIAAFERGESGWLFGAKPEDALVVLASARDQHR